MDNLTCRARIADFAQTGEDYDNLYKVILEFSQEISSLEGCNESTAFEAKSFGAHMKVVIRLILKNLT